MPKISAARARIYENPLPLSEVLTRLQAETGSENGISASSARAMKSTVIDAVRESQRDSDGRLPDKDQVLDVDLRDLLPVLHTLARRAAERKGHRSPGDHASRAARCIEVVTGERFDCSRRAVPVPAAWQPLVDGLSVRNGRSEIGFLAQCCALSTVEDAPGTLPAREDLVRAAATLYAGSEDRGRRRLAQASTVYRRARRTLLSRAAKDDRSELRRKFAPLPKQWTHNTTHLGVETETYERLEAQGLDPDDMDAEAMFRALAPDLAADYDCWAEREGSLKAESTRDQSLQALLRVAGWIIRAGHGNRLAEVSLDRLFALSVEVPGHLHLNPRIAERDFGACRPGTTQVSLLDYAAEQEAAASLSRSPIVRTADLRNGDQLPYFTQSIWRTCSLIWSMTKDLYGQLPQMGTEAEAHWALIQSRWGVLQAKLSKRQIPASRRAHTKNKARLIRTVTLPQLVCVGLPLRRREIRHLRQRWLFALNRAQEAGYDDPSDHEAVRKAANAYFAEAAIPNLILSLAVDDGLRLKQYTFGRLGEHFSIDFERDQAGRPIGIAELRTSWKGDPEDTASLKINERDNRLDSREDRPVRWGYVDRIALWDYLRWQYPRHLVANGAIGSLQEYDLEREISRAPHALFVSPKAQTDRPERSRTDLSELAGRELHYIVRKWLRPGLASWDQIRSDPEWRELWAIHITRLLTTSYWGGVRDEWDIAMYLTKDTESTLRGTYSEVAHELKDRLGTDTTDWEHPNAYDPWMDRLYKDREEFDPLDDPALPLPEGLADRIEAEDRQRGEAVKRFPATLRIRSARPDQQPPSRS